MKVFLDAGHGGTDPGAISPITGIYESEINLDVALKAGELLANRNFEVMQSRINDVNVSLVDRAVMANNWCANYFVSIHCNSIANENVTGIETFYFKDSIRGQELATILLKQLVLKTNAKELGAKEKNLAVLRLTKMPSSLVELGFITNEEEVKKLSTNEYREKCALAIADGVTEMARKYQIII